MEDAAPTVREERETTREQRLSEPRMWVFVRRDLPMPPGKLAVQAGHGFAQCIYRTMLADPERVAAYMAAAQAKVAVAVKSAEELRKAVAACDAAGLVATLIEDAAHTVFDEPTLTVGAVGPCLHEELPKSVARLQLFVATDVPYEAPAAT
jgi:PTH2 family peptidyl-tRNA hydrolase